MKNFYRYDIEKALFVAAVDGLSIDRKCGAETTGPDALVAANYLRDRLLMPRRLSDYSSEVQAYFKFIGGFVELAVNLEPVVDLKG